MRLLSILCKFYLQTSRKGGHYWGKPHTDQTVSLRIRDHLCMYRTSFRKCLRVLIFVCFILKHFTR